MIFLYHQFCWDFWEAFQVAAMSCYSMPRYSCHFYATLLSGAENQEKPSWWLSCQVMWSRGSAVISMQPFSLGDQLVNQESALSALPTPPSLPAPQGKLTSTGLQKVWSFSRLQFNLSKDRPYCHWFFLTIRSFSTSFACSGGSVGSFRSLRAICEESIKNQLTIALIHSQLVNSQLSDP